MDLEASSKINSEMNVRAGFETAQALENKFTPMLPSWTWSDHSNGKFGALNTLAQSGPSPSKMVFSRMTHKKGLENNSTIYNEVVDTHIAASGADQAGPIALPKPCTYPRVHSGFA